MMRAFSKRYEAKASAAAVSFCEFEIEGIRVCLTRKSVKNVNLRVKPTGQVEVSAPTWIAVERVEEFVRQRLPWIRARQQAFAASPRAGRELATEEEKRRWKQLVSREVPSLIARWEPLMGVESQKVAYRDMTSRWGSCNPQTGRICINIQLAAYPPQCLEYVVVHELCHLLERGHGQRFKALMTHFMPDWQERRALLK